MPQATQYESGHEVQVDPRRGATIAAQGDIEIIPQVAAERHVPPAPEILDVQRLVGRIEIDRQPDVEQERRPDRHVAIAAEIEIELERVGETGRPGAEKIERFPTLEARVCPYREGVGNDHFLEQADAENKQAKGNIPIAHDQGPARLELRHHLAVVQDRTCYEVREKGDEQRIVEEIVFPCLAAVAVHQIGYLRECEETYPQWQQQVRRNKADIERGIDVVDQEVGILEISKQTKVADDSAGQDEAARKPCRFIRRSGPVRCRSRS